MSTSSRTTSSEGKGGEMGLSKRARETRDLLLFDGVLLRFMGEAVCSLCDDEEPGA